MAKYRWRKIAGRGVLGDANWGAAGRSLSVLRKELDELSRHIGERVLLTGGGGVGAWLATLKAVELVSPRRSYVRGKHGLKVYLERLKPKLGGMTKFDPWIDSWQISVKEAANPKGQIVKMYCQTCGEEVPSPSSFRTPENLRIFMITGQCQQCQDKRSLELMKKHFFKKNPYGSQIRYPTHSSYAARQVVKRILAKYGFDNDVSIKKVDFTDLAREGVKVIAIKKWRPSALAKKVEQDIYSEIKNIDGYKYTIDFEVSYSNPYGPSGRQLEWRIDGNELMLQEGGIVLAMWYPGLYRTAGYGGFVRIYGVPRGTQSQYKNWHAWKKKVFDVYGMVPPASYVV